MYTAESIVLLNGYGIPPEVLTLCTSCTNNKYHVCSSNIKLALIPNARVTFRYTNHNLQSVNYDIHSSPQ